ncbi:MAG TPA: shikimate kinase [Pyrinomonadaceae bacterium]|nr:shikimate kinase [Pyrinomonadaceae bacterium]
MDRRIVIVGFMGCGKTTVAKALAARLDCGLADLDAIVSAQQNMSVPDLINEQGESSFRDAETAALQLILDRQTPRIIALGGGAWTLERNRDLINKHGCIAVFLDAPFDLCWQRITNHPVPRPLALDEVTARQLYDQRHPLYRLAHLRVGVTSKRSADELAAEIAEAIGLRAAPSH